MIGTAISHYRLIVSLGGGNMGVVYTAEDTRLHRFIAIKLLLSSPSALSVPTSERVRVAVRRFP